jgi:hypothetical protein
MIGMLFNGFIGGAICMIVILVIFEPVQKFTNWLIKLAHPENFMV